VAAIPVAPLPRDDPFQLDNTLTRKKARSTGSGDSELVFLPLGGSNEIGMNFNVYGYGPEGARKWLIIDCGVTFASEESLPGVDLILPDIEFLEDKVDDIVGIVLTHAHEDHIGALGWLWPKLKAPLYATPFTATLIRDKLRERGIERDVPLTEIKLGGRLSLGPFDLEYLTLTHSIAEPNGIAITTPLGVVLHTGDWKIDPSPQIGATTDVARLRELGDAGVLAMVCDSTNVFVEGESGSEATVRDGLKAVIAEQKGRVAVACFASNVARLQSVCEVAAELGRKVCLVGRSMLRITGAARSIGLLGKVNFIEPGDASYLPPDKVLYLCTGSQGEARAALARIAAGDHQQVTLGAGDTVLFSSREIPGNERGIYDLQNRLTDKGVTVITAHDRPIHVSGHPCREELKLMYQWVRPQIAIPTHGERRHLVEHAAFAKTLQISQSYATRNGELIRLAPGNLAVIDEVPSGRLYVDGDAILPADSTTMADRHRLGENGMIMIAMTIDEKGRIKAGPDVRQRGLSEKNGGPAEGRLEQIADIAEAAFNRLKGPDRTDEEAVEDAIMRAVRKACWTIFTKRPIVDVVVMTV
jgi:ribonuclease J